MTGTVVHFQLALGNLAVHIVGVDAGHHHVGFTVDDEGGLGNVCHIVLRLLTPAADSHQLTQEADNLHRGTAVRLGAGIHTVQHALRLNAALCVVGVEDVALGADLLAGCTRHVAEGGSGDGIDSSATARAGTDQHQAVDEGGVGAYNFLSDHAAHGQAQQVDLLVAEGLNNFCCLVSHAGDGGRNRAFAGTHAGQVHHNQVLVLSEQVK